MIDPAPTSRRGTPEFRSEWSPSTPLPTRDYLFPPPELLEMPHYDLSTTPSNVDSNNRPNQMPSSDDLHDGAPVGRDSAAAAPAARRTSNAFGSPGTDSTVKRIDLNDALIKHPDATFVMRAAGGAMHGAGIDDGDVLLVDRAVTASHGAVVIAVVDGELLCRRLEVSGAKPGRIVGHARLVAADSTTSPVDVGQGQLEVWGVVTKVIKSLAF